MSIGYSKFRDGRPHALTLVVVGLTYQRSVAKGVALKMRTKNPSSGFSMVELLVSVLIMGVMVAATLAEMQPTLQQFHANSSAYLVEGQLRLARQTAIAQRRDVLLTFTGTNQITLTIQNIPAGTTVLSKVFLSPTVTFLQFAGNGDTPDAFGDSGVTCFNYIPPPTGSCSNPPIIQFQSDGTLIDGNGNQLDGSIFMGVTNMATTARAVTILGATGQVRMYHGTGHGWVQQ
jgi:prepilin-type N-terminal cleavage/methylation domain-containing protein